MMNEKTEIIKFNIRVYGVMTNEKNEILVTDEIQGGKRFTKFPGGGLELGEGLIDGLKREFIEECNAKIEVLSHFYTTDFFLMSAFNDTQLISVYYKVKNIDDLKLNFKTKVFDFGTNDLTQVVQTFRWVSIKTLTEYDLTFPIDKHVVKLLKEQL